MFQQHGTPAHRAHDTVALLDQEKDARCVVVYRRLCPCTPGRFPARILTILSRSVMTTNNSAKQTIFQFTVRVLIQSSDSLLQVKHFNVT